MTDPRIADALEREHREIDAGLAEFTAALDGGEWRTQPLLDAAAALRRHIYIEEEMLFPALRAAGLWGPVAVMLREHGEIWSALDELEEVAGEQVSDDNARQVYRRLAALLEIHNDKEEAILYPQSDTVVDEATRSRIEHYLEHSTLPPGWTCQALA
ncbi:MAG: hemerythrin domain-containing protein [Dehalococcoidia bacterium]|nr:hemerythrin domain-containing protein [Dehalococcoidia bacterium]